MMQTLEQGSDWMAWSEQFEREEKSRSGACPTTHVHESRADSWEETDRQLHSRAAEPTSAPAGYGSTPGKSHSARTRWLQQHDVHTQFLDAGIGCCWFAQQGDDEPVCGETEDAAIARLAHEKGIPWGEPSKQPKASKRSKT